MRKNLLTAILMIGIFGLFGAFSINAQNNLKGRYVCAVKDGENSYSFTLNFQDKGAVFYSYEYNGYGTLEGTWSVEKEIVTVVIPNGDSTLMFKFRKNGDDLEVIETLQHSIIDAGNVFKKDVSKPTGPDLSAEDIGERVLELIKTIRAVEDISPENIERQTKIKVAFSEKDHREYGFGGNVGGAPDWTYGISTIADEKDEKPNRLMFSFDYQIPGAVNPEMTAVCGLDLDVFGRELQKAGFSSPTPIRGIHNAVSYWTSSRGKMSLNISADGEKNESNRQCVKMLTISINQNKNLD